MRLLESVLCHVPVTLGSMARGQGATVVGCSLSGNICGGSGGSTSACQEATAGLIMAIAPMRSNGSERREVGAAARFPIVSRGAEHIAIGFLMRRNILAYPAPPFNEGYDVILPRVVCLLSCERGRAAVVGLSAIAWTSSFGDASSSPCLLAVVALHGELEHRSFGCQAPQLILEPALCGNRLQGAEENIIGLETRRLKRALRRAKAADASLRIEKQSVTRKGNDRMPFRVGEFD